MEKRQRFVGGAKNTWRQRGCRAETCDGMVFDNDESQNKRPTTCKAGAADNTLRAECESIGHGESWNGQRQARDRRHSDRGDNELSPVPVFSTLQSALSGRQGPSRIHTVEIDAVVLARGWGCCSQGRSHADRPLSLRRDREDWRRSLFCLIRFSTSTVAVFLFLATDTPFRSRLGFMVTDSANRSVSEHSDADDVTRIGTSLSYCQATCSDGLDWMIRCCRSALLHQCYCYWSCCSRYDTGFRDCPTRLSPVVRFPPCLAFCLGCWIPCLYTNAWGLWM